MLRIASGRAGIPEGAERGGEGAGYHPAPFSSPIPMLIRLVAAVALLGAAAGCSDSSPPDPAPASAVSTSVRDRPAPRPEAERGLALALPTDNRALLDGRPETFYQGLHTTVDSLRPEKWEGGQYGYVRDPVPTVFGLKTLRRVHEGVDIRPLERDAQGDPVDSVRAIDAGRVAYVNPSAGASSYGKYVVVEHRWSGSPVYSLYAHLADVTVSAGDSVAQRDAVGRMGYTGSGLGRDRAHVHLEIALLVNEHFDLWFDEYFGIANPHGRFFGSNLAGVPVAELYLALEDDPGLTFPEYVHSLDDGYVVDLPGGKPLDLLSRYPWLADGGAATVAPDSVPSWRVTFTREGVPMRVEVGPEAVDRPTVEGVNLWIWLTYGSTNRVLQRRDLAYEPARSGYSYFALVSTTPEGAPRW